MSFTSQTIIKEFNSLFPSYFANPKEIKEIVLSRNLTLLASLPDLCECSLDAPETSHFYVNLYRLLSRPEVKHDIVYICIAVLQQAAESAAVREALIVQFKYLPILTKLLQVIHNPDKLIQLLSLIETLTYGIQIESVEQYLTELIKLLVSHIQSENDILFTQLSLSVLINICYKNFLVTKLLLSTVNELEFSQKIKSHGILASKMFIIIENDLNRIQTEDIHYFVKLAFAEMKKALINYNTALLKHTLYFLADFRAHEISKIALSEYKDFKSNVKEILEHVQDRSSMDQSLTSRETIKNNSVCIGVLFELLELIVELDVTLVSLYPEIIQLAMNWAVEKEAGSKAVDLVRATIQSIIDKQLTDNSILNEITAKLPALVIMVEDPAVPVEQKSSIINLTRTLLQCKEVHEIVLGTVELSTFCKLFEKFLQNDENLTLFDTMSLNEMTMYLYAIRMLLDLAAEVPVTWETIVSDLFGSKALQNLIAKGLQLKNSELCKLILHLAKHSEFPRNEVSEIFTFQQSHVQNALSLTYFEEPRKKAVGPEVPTFEISTTIQAKLDRLISHICSKSQNIASDDLRMSEIIEFFGYKIDACNYNERELIKQLEDIRTQNTNLHHRNILLISENSKYQNITLKMQINLEKIQTENRSLEKNQGTLKRSLNDFNGILEKERSKYQDHAKKIEEKQTKIVMLINENEQLKKSIAFYEVEIKKWEASTAEANLRCEEFRKGLKMCEDQLKQAEINSQSKDGQIMKLKNENECMAVQNKKLATMVEHMESEMRVRNEKVQDLEKELKIAEKMRNTIMELMQTSQTTRKS